MELNKIEDLLEKYNAALTHLEEARLKVFFEQASIAEHLKAYKRYLIVFQSVQNNPLKIKYH